MINFAVSEIKSQFTFFTEKRFIVLLCIIRHDHPLIDLLQIFNVRDDGGELILNTLGGGLHISLVS